MKTFEVTLGDGRTIEVDAPDATTAAKVAARYEAQSKPKKRTAVDEVTGFMANVNRGLGIGDELAAGARTAGNLMTGKIGLGDIPTDLRASMTRQRALEDDFATERPKSAAIARGTGSALTMAAPAGPGAAAFATGGRMVNAVRGATVAGLSGAGYAAVDRGTVQERARGAAKASVDPLTLALGAGVGALAGRGRAEAPEPAPSVDDLALQRDKAYQAVDARGERYSADAFDELTRDMAAAVDEAGFHAGLHPKTAAMLERLGQSQRGAARYEPTLKELDQLRQQIGRDVAGSPDAGERRMGAIMRSRIDDFIERQGGSEDLLRARGLNTRVAKLNSLDGLDDMAERRAARTGSGGNINNTTRQNVDRFLTDTTNLSPEEEAAARKVVMGTPAGNVLRQVGKLSPEGNGLMTGIHLVGAIPTHGLTVGAAGVGLIAKRASEAITRRNVNELRDLIARGGPQAAQEIEQQLIQAGADDLLRQLANDLSVAAGVQGASARGASMTERGVGASTR